MKTKHKRKNVRIEKNMSTVNHSVEEDAMLTLFGVWTIDGSINIFSFWEYTLIWLKKKRIFFRYFTVLTVI